MSHAASGATGPEVPISLARRAADRTGRLRIVGAAIVVAGPDSSPDALLAEADAALFDAKRAGRNRVAYGHGLGFGAASQALRAPRRPADRLRRECTDRNVG